MTEAEWLTTENQSELLKFVRGKGNERKLRLFACAVTRREWKWLIRKRNRQTVETAERFADGLATEAEMKKAAEGAYDNSRSWGKRYDTLRNANITYAVEKSCWVSQDDAWVAADWVCGPACSRDQCDLIRCVFGNPFRHVSLDPAWLAWNGGTIRQLAEAIYTERAFDRMPILADALEDAGCVEEQILTHLRGSGPHTRGCWLLDLILGKS